jgi:chromosome segregation ATPase
MRLLGIRIDAALLAGTLVLASTLATAQTARSGGSPNAQLMQQMQQLASERTSLQAENAKLKKDLEDLRKDRDALKAGREAVDRRANTSALALKQSAAQHEATEHELTQTKSKMDQLIAKFRETLDTMRTLEAEQTSTKQALATREQALTVCAERNVALYQVNEEVLTRLEHQSAWARTAQGEPFIKIKRNQLENLVDDYKQRADTQKLAPAEAMRPAIPGIPAPTPPQASPAAQPTAPAAQPAAPAAQPAIPAAQPAAPAQPPPVPAATPN